MDLKHQEVMDLPTLLAELAAMAVRAAVVELRQKAVRTEVTEDWEAVLALLLAEVKEQPHENLEKPMAICILLAVALVLTIIQIL